MSKIHLLPIINAFSGVLGSRSHNLYKRYPQLRYDHMENEVKLSLCIPFFNEEENVKDVLTSVIKAIETLKISFEIIAVDNGSMDNTRTIITSLSRMYPQIRLVVVEKNLGYGWGIISGLKTAKGHVIGFSDGDGQIAPNTVIDSYLKVQEESYDISMAVRTARGDPVGRKILSAFYKAFFFIVFHFRPRDINGKPKLIKRECWNALEIESKDWFIDTEIIIKSKKKNYKIGYVDIGFSRRKGGSSSITLSVVVEFLLNVTKLKLRGYMDVRK